MKTKETIKIIILDSMIFALIYMSIIKGNQYAENLFYPVMWILILTSFLCALGMSRDDFKEKLNDLVAKRGSFRKYYSLSYDLFLSIFLIAHGFTATGVAWFSVNIICHCILIDAKNKLNEK